MTEDPRPPVFLMGFDAAEIDVVERLIAEGRMPNLKALRERGMRGRLVNKPAHFLSLVWSTFFTSSYLGDHGWYFNKLWNQKKQRIEYADVSWLSQNPFWSGLDPRYKVAALDVPYVEVMPTGPDDSMLAGWQCHDHFGLKGKPSDLLSKLEAQFGKTKMTPEVWGGQDAQTLLSLREEVIDCTTQFAEILADYAKKERWDLLIGVFGGVHRGGHYLWDLCQIDTHGIDEKTLSKLKGAYDDTYEVLDTAFGTVLEALPADARVVTFALHGMGKNLGWYEYLPRIIEQIHRGGASAPKQKKGLLFRLRKVLPWSLVRQITRRIPHSWNRAFVPLWSRKMYDWTKTRYFCLPSDYNGYLRFNIKGREEQGIVEPAEVEAEIQTLEKALRSFRDIESGKPIFSGLKRMDDLVDSDGPERRVLPDLVVLWATDFPTSESCGVVSDTYGEVRWAKGERLRSGRSGNHTPNGWFAAAGPGIEQGELEAPVDTVDLAPTVLEWMGTSASHPLRGKPIEKLLPRAK